MLALAAAAAATVLTACSADDVTSRAADVRSSAAAAANAAGNVVGSVHTRQACVAAHDSLATLGSLATRLANDPSLRVRLAPQVTAAIKDLTDKVSAATAGWRQEWREVLQATGGLAQALRDANQTSVRLTASQVVVVVKLAQAGCALATR